MHGCQIFRDYVLQVVAFIVPPIERTIECAKKGPGGALRYLRRIYAHFHLAGLHDPTGVDAPHVVRSLVPTIRQSASTCPCPSVLLLSSSVSHFYFPLFYDDDGTRLKFYLTFDIKKNIVNTN